MPLLNDLVPNQSLLCKLWRIEEGELIMDPKTELSLNDYKLFLKKKLQQHQSQFLASRKLISQVDSDLRVSYKDDIPFLSDNRNISNSHSDNVVTI